MLLWWAVIVICGLSMSALARYLLLPAIIGALVGYGVILLQRQQATTVPVPDQAPAAPANAGYADAVAAAAPAVVNIYSTQVLRPRRHPLCDMPRYQDLCDSYAGPARRMQSSLGSGVIVREDGHILTNAHVIANADEILVAFHNDLTATATLVGTDPETDLAVIRVNAENLTPISIGSSDQARVGDIVLAIGNPFGIGQTVSKGIISAKGRHGLSASPYEDFIQTDAAINPGNSGGALVDTQGRLIGINALIYSQNGGSQGIGFAIPGQLALNVMDELIREGRVIRGFLGVEISNLPTTTDGMGLVVAEVLDGSPAAEAGIEPGDVVLAVNGQPAANARVVTRQIALTEPGTQIQLRLIRDGEPIEVEATAGVRPIPD